MFISKRKLNEMLNAERDKMWRDYHENRQEDIIDRRFRELEQRIKQIEKVTGIVKEKQCCCCHKEEEVPIPNQIGFGY